MVYYHTTAWKIVTTGLFTLFILFLFVLTLEFVLRTTHLFGAKITWTSPDPTLGYTFLPGREYWCRSENDHPITGRINSHGWRDTERSLTKPENTYRIAVLGDSFVEALQVEREATFLALAENQLSAVTGHSVEIMNFGRSGYSQTEEFLVLKNHVTKFSPNLVLLFFFPGNDIADVDKRTAVNSQRPFFSLSESGELTLDSSFSRTQEFKLRSFVSWFRQHSAFISLLSDRYVIYRAVRAETLSQRHHETSTGKLQGYLGLCTSSPGGVFLQNYKLTKQLIAAMAEHCELNKIRLMLICCNVYYSLELEKEYRQIDQTFNPNFFEDDLKEYARSINIEYLGLQRIFRQASIETGFPYHWRSGGHWNYQGHRLVARSLVDRLKVSIRNEVSPQQALGYHADSALLRR